MATKIGGASSISPSHQPSRRRNWPLILGGWIVAGVDTGRYRRAVAGAARPAGSARPQCRWVTAGSARPTHPHCGLLAPDQAGRDLISRLLWAGAADAAAGDRHRPGASGRRHGGRSAGRVCGRQCFSASSTASSGGTALPRARRRPGGDCLRWHPARLLAFILGFVADRLGGDGAMSRRRRARSNTELYRGKRVAWAPAMRTCWSIMSCATSRRWGRCCLPSK